MHARGGSRHGFVAGATVGSAWVAVGLLVGAATENLAATISFGLVLLLMILLAIRSIVQLLRLR